MQPFVCNTSVSKNLEMLLMPFVASSGHSLPGKLALNVQAGLGVIQRAAWPQFDDHRSPQRDLT